MVNKIALAFAAAVSLVLFGPAAGGAHAAVVMTLEQEGSNVVATGSGTIDLTDLTLISSITNVPGIAPDGSAILAGATLSADVYGFLFTAPPKGSLGSGSQTDANSGIGNPFGVTDAVVVVPHNYASGTALSDSATWDSTTLAMLGVTPGTYAYTWGFGAHADSVTLDVLNPVPVPAALPLFATGLGGLGLLGWRRKRKAQAAA